MTIFIERAKALHADSDAVKHKQAVILTITEMRPNANNDRFEFCTRTANYIYEAFPYSCAPGSVNDARLIAINKFFPR